MAKCQYIRENDLPPSATQDEVTHVRHACDQRATAQLGYSAKQSTAKWRLPEVQLRGAIIRHIAAGKKMFHKYKDDGSGDLLLGHVQANITLPIGFDIYVEVILMEKDMIIMYAHDHTLGKLRLPQ
jgi:hypothetical protein